MMRKTNEGRSPVGVLLPAAAAGLLMTLLLMLIGAVMVHRGTIAEGAIAPCAWAFLSVGSVLAGLVAARRAAGNRFFWALGAGVVVFLILLAAGAILGSQPIHMVRTAVSLLCALAASALGGLAGANMRKKKRYSHIKK